MLYTIIIVSILVVGLTAGMYFSSYQNINEKLALKKKYLRADNIFFKSPKIKSRVSYSFGTIACLVLVFMILNDPTVNLPFNRFTSAEVFNETIDELILENPQKEIDLAIDIVAQVNQKPEQHKKVLEDSQRFLLITNNSLLSISKLQLNNYHQSRSKINQTVYYYSNSLVRINGIIDYKDNIITYGDYNQPDSTIKESVIYLHQKDDLNLLHTIYIKGQIESIIIEKDFLYCITTNELHKNENYYGKITGIKFNYQEKYQTNDYKDIYYIPNNNIKHALGFVKINLKKNKYYMETLLVSDYFLAINDSQVYLSVNIDLPINQTLQNGYIVQYNFNKMRIEKSNKIEGNIYNDFIFDDSGGFIVTTLTHQHGKHYYKVYMYDKNFYLKKTYDITSQDTEILIQNVGFNYLVDMGSKKIRFAGERCLPNNTFSVIPNEQTLDNIDAFNKVFHDKIILYSKEEDQIKLKQYNIVKDIMEQEIELAIKDKSLQKIVFDSYYYDNKVYNFINIQVLEDGYFTYFVIPYIEDRMYPEYRFSFTSSLSMNKVSHFYINNYFIIFKEDSILMFSNEKVDSSIEIRLK